MDGSFNVTRALRVEIRTTLTARNFETLAESIVDPGSYDGTLEKSANGMRWLLIARENGRYGWSFRALERRLMDDEVRIFLDGREINGLDEL